jgi:poly(3-hydroxybutyrate) depolymerase
LDDIPERETDAIGRWGANNIKWLLFKVGAVAAFLALLLLPGLKQIFSGGGPPYRTGLSRKLEFRLDNRSVLLYAPAAQLSDKPLPMVVVLHGSNTSIYEMANMTRYHNVMNSALVVYPEMRIPKGQTWDYGASWETSFFKTLPHTAVKAGCKVDFSKVFIIGHSSGGSMSLFLQNNMPDLFRAAAAVEAGVGRLEEWHNQSAGRPVMLVWNHNDPVLQYFGGESLYFTSLRQLRRHDPTGPTANPSYVTEVALPEAQTSGIAYAEWMAWPAVGRASVLEVVSWKSWNPTHSWASQRAVPGAFDAAVITWDFFRRMAQIA